MNDKNHWDHIYNTKQSNEVSWTQEIPSQAINFIKKFNLPRSSSIIDIGGGDSRLVDCLLEMGYENISVLDISYRAIEKAKCRLADRSERVEWIVADVSEFLPEKKYDWWYDRAAFHFLMHDEIRKYVDLARTAIRNDGYLTIGTFSMQGPAKCSGLNVQRYSESSLAVLLSEQFEKIKCTTEDHQTPFLTKQNFLFCHFRKRFEQTIKFNG